MKNITVLSTVLIGILVTGVLLSSVPDAFATQSITLDHASLNQKTGKFNAILSISGFTIDNNENFDIIFGLVNRDKNENDVSGEIFDERGNIHQKPQLPDPLVNQFVALQHAKLNLNSGKVTFQAISAGFTLSPIGEFEVVVGLINTSTNEGALELFPLN